MNKVAKWGIFNGAFLVLMYLAYTIECVGAYNMLMFFSWLLIISTLFLLNKDVQMALIEKRITRSVPQWVNVSFDILVISVFSWFGNFFTAIGWFVHLLIQESYFKNVEQIKDKNDVS